jgi:DNA replication protein DnaC
MSCKMCQGVGYTLTSEGEFATAKVCECQIACKKCSGTGFLITMVDGYEIAKPCLCSSAPHRVSCYNRALIPAHFAHKSLSGFQATKHNQSIKTKLLAYQKNFRKNGARGQLLIGEPGVGKTHLVTALLHYFTLERGISCRFVDFFKLTADIRATYTKDSQGSESYLIEPLVNVPVLVIDELGKGKGSSWELSIVDQLISRRYNSGRVILGTTNYFPEGVQPSNATSKGLPYSLEERVGPRIFSRLSEMSDFHVVEGQDFRRLK